MENTKKKEPVEIVVTVNEEEVSQAMANYKKGKENPWDPVDAFNLGNITKNAARILARYAKLKMNPDLPKKHQKRLIIFAACIILLSIIPIIFYGNYIVTIIALIFAAVMYGVIFSEYRKLAIDIIKISTAEEHNWYYDPAEDPDKWSLLEKEFPEVFRFGSKNQNVEDQFWGSIQRDENEYDFYSGLFHYTTVTKGHSTTTAGGQRSTTSDSTSTYHHNFICFRLKNELETRLLLQAYKVMKKEKAPDTNPLSFTEAFKLSFEGSVEESSTDILKTLSKSVQNNLLDMRKARGPFNVLFTKDCVIFSFYGPLFKSTKTDLMHKGLDIRSEDKEFIDKNMNELLDLTIEIVKYLK
ncbi:hypothetical protein ACFLU5_14070 [Bacteroidota bacterium]